MIKCERCGKLISWKDVRLENGNWTITCPDCGREIIIPLEYDETDVINRIIEDTSVPKTYRASFKQYLKWREKQ